MHDEFRGEAKDGVATSGEHLSSEREPNHPSVDGTSHGLGLCQADPHRDTRSPTGDASAPLCDLIPRPPGISAIP